jgi:hypothetical protein
MINIKALVLLNTVVPSNKQHIIQFKHEKNIFLSKCKNKKQINKKKNVSDEGKNCNISFDLAFQNLLLYSLIRPTFLEIYCFRQSMTMPTKDKRNTALINSYFIFLISPVFFDEESVFGNYFHFALSTK